MDATYRCSEVLPLFRGYAVDTLQGLDFYLKTLEEFIEREHSQELADLKQHGYRLPQDQQGEFWAWHYPVHWDEIFASQLRSSFVVTLVSLVESHVGMVAEQACEIAGTPLKPKDLRGGFLERHRKCLQALASFTRPTDAIWDAVYEIRDVRNCIVHANSRIWETTNQQRLRSLVGRLPGLSASQDVIELSKEFPTHTLETVRGFILAIYDEAEKECTRVTTRRP